jgi:hypothetical protein
MKNAPLTSGTKQRIAAMFVEGEQAEAEQLLVEECGANLPFVSNSASDLERIRFAALKVSDGDLDRLYEAIELAQTDWRDLLVTADFGEDPEAHAQWFPNENAL